MEKQPKEPWTHQEVIKLMKHYPDTNNEDLALIIGRSTSAVAHKASKLRLKKSEAFLASANSGRFRVRVSFWQSLKNFFHHA